MGKTSIRKSGKIKGKRGKMFAKNILSRKDTNQNNTEKKIWKSIINYINGKTLTGLICINMAFGYIFDYHANPLKYSSHPEKKFDQYENLHYDNNTFYKRIPASLGINIPFHIQVDKNPQEREIRKIFENQKNRCPTMEERIVKTMVERFGEYTSLSELEVSKGIEHRKLILNIVDKWIGYYASADSRNFKDNAFYQSLRNVENSAWKERLLGKEYTGNLLIINKTFQKAMLYHRGITYEWDCTTALRYGKKEYNGDGKTPEGLFRIESIVPSFNKVFDNKKAYGPFFCRLNHPIFRSIGLHGNGTDTSKFANWESDKQYMPPDPLGISANNFAYGVSHGCIRLPNHVLEELIENKLIHEGMPIIIYENKPLTACLNEHYNSDKNYFNAKIFDDLAENQTIETRGGKDFVTKN